MAFLHGYRKGKKLIKYAVIITLILFVILFLFANRFVEPILRERLHTLIIRGSDSLYNYKLGKLKANFFGGNVEVENLQIRVDSLRYFIMLSENSLPSLTMQLNLQKGKIKGLGVFSLIFRKRIRISEILSEEADIKLSRHYNKEGSAENKVVPLWKAIQPNIKSISIDKINLDGVKLLYRNADTSESVKLQFDRCEALFQDVVVDSAATADTSRIGFAKELTLQFYDLKFRTPDSTYKMKAELIHYSSVKKTLQVKDFKLQPTLEGGDFFKYATIQKSRYFLEFEQVTFTNLFLDRFIHNNMIIADSVFIERPVLHIGNDKTLPPDMKSKIGNYPHQKLLKADPLIRIKGIKINNAQVNYIEKGEKTAREGNLVFDNLNAVFSNITNDARLIKNNAECTASVNAVVFNTSPIQAQFVFYLDSTEGEFDVRGKVHDLNASQLNAAVEPLANTRINSLKIYSLAFQLHGDDFAGNGKIQMRYSDLAITLRKTDEQTGITKTKKFLTKIINKFTIYPSNPSQGIERSANNVVYARTSSKSFFGVVWKTIFFGMQQIMLKSGRYQ